MLPIHALILHISITFSLTHVQDGPFWLLQLNSAMIVRLKNVYVRSYKNKNEKDYNKVKRRNGSKKFYVFLIIIFKMYHSNTRINSHHADQVVTNRASACCS